MQLIRDNLTLWTSAAVPQEQANNEAVLASLSEALAECCPVLAQSRVMRLLYEYCEEKSEPEEVQD
jgi:hypothetical protein